MFLSNISFVVHIFAISDGQVVFVIAVIVASLQSALLCFALLPLFGIECKKVIWDNVSAIKFNVCVPLLPIEMYSCKGNA